MISGKRYTHRIDVHVLTIPRTNREHLKKCLDSLADEPVNVFLLEGIAGDVGTSRHNGFLQGTAEFCSFVDDDDMVEPGIFKKCLDFLDANPGAVGCYTDQVLIDAAGAVLCNGWSIDPAPFLVEHREILGLTEHPRHKGKYYHHLLVLRREAVMKSLGAIRGQKKIVEPLLVNRMCNYGDLLHLPVMGYRWRIYGGNSFSKYTPAEVMRAKRTMESESAIIEGGGSLDSLDWQLPDHT